MSDEFTHRKHTNLLHHRLCAPESDTMTVKQRTPGVEIFHRGMEGLRSVSTLPVTIPFLAYPTGRRVL